jgi:cytochrome b561
MPARYSATQQVLHWLTAALMFAVLPVGWIATAIPEDTKEFYFWLDVHKLIGLTILCLTAGRILWRLFDRPPALPSDVSAWNRRLAQGVAGGLLAMMVVMPVTGYLWTSGHGHDVAPLNLFKLPRFFFNDQALGDLAKSLHLWGRWIVYLLIALHLAGVSYHLVFRRDRLLERMLPRQNPQTDPG